MNFFYHCPRCQSYETLRSRRKAFERFLFGLRPYHCSHCDHRFYAPMPANEVPMRSKLVERLQRINPFTMIAFRTNARTRTLISTTGRSVPDLRVHTTTRIVSTMASTKLSKT